MTIIAQDIIAHCIGKDPNDNQRHMLMRAQFKVREEDVYDFFI